MDFNQLTDEELAEFLGGFSQTYNKVELAAQRWDNMVQHGLEFYHLPIPVAALYLATQIDVENLRTYTTGEIQNADMYFIEDLNNKLQINDIIGHQLNLDLDENKFLILKILTILDLLYDLPILQIPILDQLCQHLSLDDLNNFRISQGLDRIMCQIPVRDIDGDVKSIPYLDDETFDLAKNIERHGSQYEFLTSLNKFPNITRLLLEWGVPPYKESYYMDEIIPIHQATAHLDFELTKILLDYGADPNHQYGESTPLILAIDGSPLEPEDFEVVKLLLERGADPNFFPEDYYFEEENNFQRSPLIEAIGDDQVEIINTLLEYGANPNLSIITTDDNSIDTPLLAAVDNNNLRLVKLLVDEGADPNFTGPNEISPIYWATEKGYNDILEYLIEHQIN